ncbi:MAG: PQQ-like beta-propeller repeat protein [Acidobacteria bacterium]|nr:PQQ-like beta-propeller repeat protein [Acidobacteriota bacterium]
MEWRKGILLAAWATCALSAQPRAAANAPVLNQPCAPGVEPRTDSTFWNGWGVDAANSRYQPAAMAGLSAADIPRLKLKWAFRLPGSNAAVSQPALVGGRLYLGSAAGTVYSLDAATGCVYWTFQADAPVRTAITIGANRHAKYALFFADTKAQAYSIDAKTGSLVWKTRLDNHPAARVTASPTLYGGRLYVPVACEPGPAAPASCRASLMAIDNESGKVDWKTAAPASSTYAPTLDLDKRLLYAAASSSAAAPAPSAILALDMDTGRQVWSKALPPAAITASPILRKLPSGKRLLLTSQNSGLVHALNPDAQGATLWQTRARQVSAPAGSPSAPHWGLAADAEAVYVPSSTGLAALRLTDGAKLWRVDGAAQQAAPTLIPGVVFSGSMDGKLRAHSTRDGTLLWSFDTLTQPGGGSINIYSAIAAQGFLIVPSGPATPGGLPGNVLLAFTVDGR